LHLTELRMAAEIDYLMSHEGDDADVLLLDNESSGAENESLMDCVVTMTESTESVRDQSSQRNGESNKVLRGPRAKGRYGVRPRKLVEALEQSRHQNYLTIHTTKSDPTKFMEKFKLLAAEEQHAQVLSFLQEEKVRIDFKNRNQAIKILNEYQAVDEQPMNEGRILVHERVRTLLTYMCIKPAMKKGRGNTCDWQSPECPWAWSEEEFKKKWLKPQKAFLLCLPAPPTSPPLPPSTSSLLLLPLPPCPTNTSSSE